MSEAEAPQYSVFPPAQLDSGGMLMLKNGDLLSKGFTTGTFVHGANPLELPPITSLITVGTVYFVREMLKPDCHAASAVSKT